MKIRRLKKVHKNLSFFVNNYKFHQPYQVLIDGTFSFAALENKFNIQDQLSKYFQSEVKLLTTQCVILEAEKLGSKLYGALLIIKQFPVHKCGHEKQPITGSKCLSSMVGSCNPSRYIIATQDRLLQDTLRNIPGVPVMYLHGKAPTFEAPSQASREYAEKMRAGIIMSDVQEETLKALKKQSGLETEIKTKFKKKRKGGPNPLSCKKKKKKEGNEKSKKISESGKVRKRKRVKLASHVKQALKASI